MPSKCYCGAEAVSGNYCQACLDAEVADLSDDDLCAASEMLRRIMTDKCYANNSVFTEQIRKLKEAQEQKDSDEAGDRWPDGP